MDVRAGPFFYEVGTLTAADKDAIYDATKVNTNIRDRKQWGWKRGLTLCGPASGIDQAKQMAVSFIQKSAAQAPKPGAIRAERLAKAQTTKAASQASWPCKEPRPESCCSSQSSHFWSQQQDQTHRAHQNLHEQWSWQSHVYGGWQQPFMVAVAHHPWSAWKPQKWLASQGKRRNVTERDECQPHATWENWQPARGPKQTQGVRPPMTPCGPQKAQGVRHPMTPKSSSSSSSCASNSNSSSSKGKQQQAAKSTEKPVANEKAKVHIVGNEAVTTLPDAAIRYQ